MAQFYGEQKVRDIEENGDRVTVTLDDGKKVEMTKKMFAVSVIGHRQNPTELWNKQLMPVCHEIVELLLAWDVKLDQLDYLINMMKDTVEGNLAVAGDILWDKKLSERKMSDVERVLKSKQEDGKQTTGE